MSDDGLSIPRQPGRSPAADYYALRRDGIGFIEQMGSALWTDYNTHDPGITIHEGMCYAITELAYRIGWDIKDLLVPAGGGEAPAQPFFSAREILTVNPVTPDDWRRLLVGLAGVRNAWVSCKECACDVVHYAWCAPDGQPKLGWRRPAGAAEDVHRIDVRGMIEALVELEADPEAGDLDERKAERDATLPGTRASLALEMRFPDWELARPGEWQTFLGPGSVSKITLARLGARKDYDLFGDPLLDDEGRDRYLRAHWKGALYASFTLTVEPGGLSLPLEQVALHLFGDNAARGALTAPGLKARPPTGLSSVTGPKRAKPRPCWRRRVRGCMRIATWTRISAASPRSGSRMWPCAPTSKWPPTPTSSWCRPRPGSPSSATSIRRCRVTACRSCWTRACRSRTSSTGPRPTAVSSNRPTWAPRACARCCAARTWSTC
jgi:hypothetical protein